MAASVDSPQLENGYVKIATEITEAFSKYRIPGAEMQCLWFIIRKTYGWNKKEDAISITQFEKATGMKRSHVCRAIAGLSNKNIISTNKGTTTVTKYQFNKRYKTWVVSPKKDTSPKLGTVASPNKGNQVVPIKVHTIDTITKDTITKDKLHMSKKNGLSKKAKAVLRYLNRNKKSKYKDYTNILARLNDGGTIQECLQIIDNKFSDNYFLEHPKFLNPATLFRKSHWDKYLNETPDKTQHDKLLEVGNSWLKKQEMQDS